MFIILSSVPTAGSPGSSLKYFAAAAFAKAKSARALSIILFSSLLPPDVDLAALEASKDLADCIFCYMPSKLIMSES